MDLLNICNLRAQHINLHLTQKLLTSLRYPWLSERARLALSRSTGLRRKVIALAANPNPETELSRLDQIRLLMGF